MNVVDVTDLVLLILTATVMVTLEIVLVSVTVMLTEMNAVNVTETVSQKDNVIVKDPT